MSGVEVTLAVLMLAAFVGGALNAVAGGGTFLTFPAMVWTGADAVVANATSSFALWPGSAASGVGYARSLPKEKSFLAQMIAVSALGGMLGALLLVRTPSKVFVLLVPWLMFLATLVFTFAPRLMKQLASPLPGSIASVARSERKTLALALQLPISFYGGYFGGGMGFLMLAAYAIALPQLDFHAHNALKSVLAVVLNAFALVTFVLAGTLAWESGLVMAVGASAGGWVGARAALEVSASKMRTFVAVLGWVMTVLFFIHAYRPR